ncbi:uncharacterized protein MKK02DRAFT_29082 [Dioszegia hungarica]|uniref:Uncharacterized protein n=1 Tax=Dioszegia hungarica TaxID=4972 RepID=A0AA38H637_9TREE|nr:uncharacterized protein MKK02DRAFT_29082 [Dioszegia hungarica]KAI9633204.1 hypothetical protein MKK02DRAFT_29082 [Dioszegia hungarica]
MSDNDTAYWRAVIDPYRQGSEARAKLLSRTDTVKGVTERFSDISHVVANQAKEERTDFLGGLSRTARISRELCQVPKDERRAYIDSLDAEHKQLPQGSEKWKEERLQMHMWLAHADEATGYLTAHKVPIHAEWQNEHWRVNSEEETAYTALLKEQAEQEVEDDRDPEKAKEAKARLKKLKKANARLRTLATRMEIAHTLYTFVRAGLGMGGDGTHKPWELDSTWCDTPRKISAIPDLKKERKEELLELRLRATSGSGGSGTGADTGTEVTVYLHGDLPEARLMSDHSMYAMHEDNDPLPSEAMDEDGRKETRTFYETQLRDLQATVGQSAAKADKDSILDAQASVCVCLMTEADVLINSWQNKFAEHLRPGETRAKFGANSDGTRSEKDAIDMWRFKRAIRDAEVACMIYKGSELIRSDPGSGAQCDTCDAGDRCAEHWWRRPTAPGMSRYLKDQGAPRIAPRAAGRCLSSGLTQQL